MTAVSTPCLDFAILVCAMNGISKSACKTVFGHLMSCSHLIARIADFFLNDRSDKLKGDPATYT